MKILNLFHFTMYSIFVEHRKPKRPLHLKKKVTFGRKKCHNREKMVKKVSICLSLTFGNVVMC